MLEMVFQNEAARKKALSAEESQMILNTAMKKESNELEENFISINNIVIKPETPNALTANLSVNNNLLKKNLEKSLKFEVHISDKKKSKCIIP